MRMQIVVAGVIVQKNKLLITQRVPTDKIFPLQWEFPGGKVEEGESEQDALIRELIEEIGVVTTVGAYIGEVTFSHKNKDYLIKYYFCTITSGELQPLEVHNMAWITREERNKYDLAEEDKNIIAKL